MASVPAATRSTPDQIAYKIDFVFQDKTEIHVIEGTFKRKK